MCSKSKNCKVLQTLRDYGTNKERLQNSIYAILAKKINSKRQSREADEP